MYSEGFLRDFFSTRSSSEYIGEILKHFIGTFQKPMGFDDLVDSIDPEEGVKKIVVVDGHPRSGKTWMTAAAVASIVERNGSLLEGVYSSKRDSDTIFESEDITVADGVKSLIKKVKEGAQRIVLVDDLFGTNRPRPLGDLDYLRHALSWTGSGDLIQALPETSTLILTGRSLFFSLFEIASDMSLRKREPTTLEDGLVYIPHRVGLFSDPQNKGLRGYLDSEHLRMLSQRNRKTHPYGMAGSEGLLFLSTPLMAFDSNEELTEDLECTSAKVLFRDDLDCLAETVKASRDSCDADSDRLSRLVRAYLGCVGPSLMFLGPRAYEVIGIGAETADLLIDDLYLYASLGDFRVGLLPNQFYMVALDEHFEANIDLVAWSLSYVLLSGDRPVSERSLGVGVAVRGLIERVLHRAVRGTYQQLLDSPDYDSLEAALVDNYRNDPLLELLRAGSRPSESAEIGSRLGLDHVRPGHAAALGWARLSLFGPVDDNERDPYEGLRKSVSNWFFSTFEKLIEHNSANCVFNGNCREHSQRVVAFYSTYLQWLMRAYSRTEVRESLLEDYSSELDQLITRAEYMCESPDPFTSDTGQRVMLAIEDELVWAVLEEGYSLTDKALGVVEHALDPNAVADEKVTANRFFTLAWHNAWMDKVFPGESEEQQVVGRLDELAWERFVDMAQEWIDRRRDEAIRSIEVKPGLVADNLQYHWHHFLAQRSTWMRDWCFERDPNRFALETSQVTSGSKSDQDVNEPPNQDFVQLVELLLRDGASPDVVAPIMFVVGLRRNRLPKAEYGSDGENRLLGLLGDLMSKSDEYHQAGLEGVFELARHQYSRRRPDEPDVRFSCFTRWCGEMVERDQKQLSGAWRKYLEDLRCLAHPLDLLPSEDRGWIDLGIDTSQQGGL